MPDRKQKYNYLRNWGFSPDDARKMRSWSWDRITNAVTGEYKDYKSPYTAKREVNVEMKGKAERRAEGKSKAEIRRTKYDYLRALGFSSEIASKGRDWSWDRITNRTVRYDVKAGSELSQDKKELRWSQWSSRGNYPLGIEKFAEEMNRRNGFDINSSAGWALAYYNYVEGYSLEMLQELDIDEEYLALPIIKG